MHGDWRRLHWFYAFREESSDQLMSNNWTPYIWQHVECGIADWTESPSGLALALRPGLRPNWGSNIHMVTPVGRKQTETRSKIHHGERSGRRAWRRKTDTDQYTVQRTGRSVHGLRHCCVYCVCTVCIQTQHAGWSVEQHVWSILERLRIPTKWHKQTPPHRYNLTPSRDLQLSVTT